MLFPIRCPVCRTPGAAPCRGCADRLRSLVPRPEDPPGGLDALVAPFAYRDEVRTLVAAIKFRNDRAALGWTADRMVEALARAGHGMRSSLDTAVVTWAPTSGVRRRRRGYDQAELLARAVARRLGVRPAGLLCRLPGRPLTGRPLVARTGAVRFVARPVRPVRPGATVVVVDDVYTSGTTLQAAARALREAGASTVVGLVVARTPAASRGRDPAVPGLGWPP